MKPTGLDDFHNTPADDCTAVDWFLAAVALVIVLALFCTEGRVFS